MKVICVDSTNDWSNLLKEGVEYTAIGETNDNAYILHEVKHPFAPTTKGYKKYRFIPLSNIDETEMLREYRDLVNDKT